MKKYAVAFEPDVKQGICYLARLDAGQGEVALFDTPEQARVWIDGGEDIDGSIFETAVIEVYTE